MKNYRKKLLQCLVVMFLTMALAATFIPISTDAAAEKANGTISRVEWLHGLIGLFDMTVEEDNYPDNYFSDISSADSCYRDIMVATEFGLVDVEEGFDMRPDDPVTREFAAYTMNVCLGYVLEETDTYTFSDQDAFTYYGKEIAESYYQAAQVALKRGWMTLVNGTFAPQSNLTQDEKSVMWSDAQESIASKVIDKDYDNKVTFAEGVIEVPEGTKFELEEYDTGTFVTLFEYNGLISDGDTFALWVNGLPAVYDAVAVEDMGDSLVIQITEGDENSAIQELDAQGTAEADLATAVQEGEGTMTWIAGGTEEKNYEDGREVRDPRAAGSVPIKAIKRTIPIKLYGGLSATLNVTVPKPTVAYKINGIKEVYVALNADTTVSATVKGNMIDSLGLPSSIDVVYIPIGGIGEASISVSIAASGQCSVNYNFDAVAGIHYRKGEGTSLVTSFKKKSFTVSAQAELSATWSATLGVTKIPKVNASVWAKIGPRMGLSAWTYGDGKKPTACMDTYGYMYAGVGATLRLLGKDYSPRPNEIWTKQNSPVRVAAHYEDGVRTSACTRDASQRRYYTRDTSRYFSDGSGIYDSTGSSGSGTVIQPRYEYSLSKNDRDQDVAKITKYYGSVSAIVIPNTIDGYPVVAIGNQAFARNSYLKTVLIPDSITLIEQEAFAECRNLEMVTLSSNLEELYDRVFYNNDMLTSIEIPKSLKELTTNFGADAGPFNSCDGLKNVSFEQGTTKIASVLFANCPGIESIVIPDTVTDIEYYAFYGSKNLREVTMPESITSIGWSAFEKCTGLTNILIPKSVTAIGQSAFADCTNLESIQLPDSITDITDYMFQNCTALKNITIPKSITEIGRYALEGCSALNKVAIQDAKTYIGSYAFRNCTALTEMDFGKEITEIGGHAFYGCDALSSIVVPDSVTIIGGYCFEDCDVLQNVSLGTGITEIPEGAFYQCGSLEKIVLPYRVSRIRTKAFINCTKLTSITIPRSVTAIDDNVFSYPGKMTIYGVSGTYAQTYARDKGISFISNEVHATSAALSSATLKLNKGSTAVLALTVEPADFTDEVTWKSTDTSVAAISDSGMVTAKEVGTATIRVIVGNISADCKVTVGQPVTSISLNEDYLSLEALDTYQLTASVYPTNADKKEVEWISSDETVAAVDQTGLVTALAKGEATITALAKDGSNQSSECTVTVKNTMYAVTSAEKMESPHEYEINCSDIWVYTDENAEDSLEVVFDERTEVEDGFDFIYIYSADGTQIGKYTGTQLSGATVEVPGNTVKIKLVSDEAGNAWGFKVKSIHAASGRLPQKIAGAGAYTKVYGDSRFLLDCQITEGNGTLSYISDNGEVVSVDEKGNITIHGAGTATVTAIASMTADYRKTEKRITITVNKARQNLKVFSETNAIRAGQSLKLHVVSKTGVLRFSSDKEEVVKVDQEGNAVGQAAGTANITVTAVGNKNYLEETQQITILVTAASKKRDNTIRANDITKTYSAKVRKVNIGAKAESGAKLTYVSNNKFVKVDSDGKVTIAKKFIGKAEIMIRSASTQNYNAASKTIAVTVNPPGTSIKKVKNTGRKKATVFWKKSGVATGYEIQYSTNKKFKSGIKSKIVKKKGTAKLVLPSLKKGKTYLVRIRTYKTVNNEKFYSLWSKAKSVKIKR